MASAAIRSLQFPQRPPRRLVERRAGADQPGQTDAHHARAAAQQPDPPVPAVRELEHVPSQHIAQQRRSGGSQHAGQQGQRQAEADAAQRERMRAAMGEQDGQRTGKTPPDGAVVQAETAEQRERRQAVEAWLKRVPDEPGALLKAKFRLEHERRQKEGQ